MFFFFFQAEDGIRDIGVTGVQTCALPISTFRKHVEFYCTKALTTVKAMAMLGNSSRGITPLQKRLLYRSCVLPLATYGSRLWYHKGAKNKTVLKTLTTMQRRAARWITGAFRTTPGLATETIAALPPIHLHLKK